MSSRPSPIEDSPCRVSQRLPVGIVWKFEEVGAPRHLTVAQNYEKEQAQFQLIIVRECLNESETTTVKRESLGGYQT
ncbi:hypothetical protein TNCV_4292951 [Trichonephila clavipes]|uniref:Uncharacterized protein n=1 Tax=Trichonephila clavipes TaxID=2585209 RepID=A0A8X6RGL7_TRICX|nr:hypothetical protein TNCV_4292951 [Trichonephila clavipes]